MNTPRLLAPPALKRTDRAYMSVVVGGTRHYRVGEIRRWLQGEWEGVQR
jgi:hypothetical protein